MSETPVWARIPGRYARSLLLRGVFLWTGARLMLMVLYLFIASNADKETAEAFTDFNPLVVTMWALILTVALVRIDLHRRHEVDLLSNLGVITAHAVVIGTLPAVAMETALAILR